MNRCECELEPKADVEQLRRRADFLLPPAGPDGRTPPPPPPPPPGAPGPGPAPTPGDNDSRLTLQPNQPGVSASADAAITAALVYLLRRSQNPRLRPGLLQDITTASFVNGVTPPPRVAYGVKWQDDIERADSATLGGDWVEDGTGSYWTVASGRAHYSSGVGRQGDAWATGSAVASGKSRYAFALFGMKGQTGVGYGSAGNSIAILDGGSKLGNIGDCVENGYALRLTASNTCYLRRVVGATETNLGGSFAPPWNNTTGTDVTLEVEKIGDSVWVRLYVAGVLTVEREDATPGAAAGVATSAQPVLRAGGSQAFNFEAAAVSY